MSELFKNPFFKASSPTNGENDDTQTGSDFEDELETFSDSSSSESSPPRSPELTDSIESEKSYENLECPSNKRRRTLNKTSKPKKSVKTRYILPTQPHSVEKSLKIRSQFLQKKNAYFFRQTKAKLNY